VLAADIADAEMRLAALELDEGQANSARRRLNEAIGRYEALAVTEKDEPHWRAVLSDAWALAAEADYVRGASDAARSAMDKALQARIRLAARYPPEAWALSGIWRVRAALRAALGDADVAAESLQQARALAEALCAQAEPGDAPARFLVHTLLDQADHALRTGDLNRAREAADTARLRAESLAKEQDAPPAWLGETGACWDRLGEVARAMGAKAQAQEAFSRAVEFRRMACDRAPAEKQFASGLSAALLKFGEAAMDAGALASARNAFNEGAAIRLEIAQAEPNDPRAAKALAAALERIGLAAHAAGDHHAARGAWEDELLLAERIFPNEDDLDGARFRATVEAHLATLGGGKAETHRVNALEHFDALAKAGVLTEREAVLRRKLWGG
jgi:tetratricopeptide (TPR) repeat protein